MASAGDGGPQFVDADNRAMLIYTDGSWPLWVRALIAVFAAGLVAMMGWRYYKHYWRRR